MLGFNFRPDRMREITRALAEPGFDEIDRGGAAVVERYATLAEYDEDWDYPVVFPPERPDVTLAQVIADRGLKQLHVAETEKYPHVTYFFNGGEEDEHEGETFAARAVAARRPDLRPQAGDERLRGDRRVRRALRGRRAGVRDHQLRQRRHGRPHGRDRGRGEGGRDRRRVPRAVVEAVHAAGGACIVTADHGNADEMLEEDGSPDTAHSLNPVPFVVTAGADALDGEGILADVAPTALALLGIEQPPEMTGRSLLA